MTQSKAKQANGDIVSRLAGAGEEAMQRIGDLPYGKAILDAGQVLRERIDELAMRIRAIDPLEKRVAVLEKRLAALEKKPATRKRAPAKSAPKPKP